MWVTFDLKFYLPRLINLTPRPRPRPISQVPKIKYEFPNECLYKSSIFFQNCWEKLCFCLSNLPEMSYSTKGFFSLGSDCQLFLSLSSTWGQFHQRSMRSFYIHKLCTQLFCAYIFGLYCTGARRTCKTVGAKAVRIMLVKLSPDWWHQ
jgi:hypothetical protein